MRPAGAVLHGDRPTLLGFDEIESLNDVFMDDGDPRPACCSSVDNTDAQPYTCTPGGHGPRFDTNSVGGEMCTGSNNAERQASCGGGAALRPGGGALQSSTTLQPPQGRTAI